MPFAVSQGGCSPQAKLPLHRAAQSLCHRLAHGVAPALARLPLRPLHTSGSMSCAATSPGLRSRSQPA